MNKNSPYVLCGSCRELLATTLRDNNGGGDEIRLRDAPGIRNRDDVILLQLQQVGVTRRELGPRGTWIKIHNKVDVEVHILL